jgi:hypothetical protein
MDKNIETNTVINNSGPNSNLLAVLDSLSSKIANLRENLEIITEEQENCGKLNNNNNGTGPNHQPRAHRTLQNQPQIQHQQRLLE